MVTTIYNTTIGELDMVNTKSEIIRCFQAYKDQFQFIQLSTGSNKYLSLPGCAVEITMNGDIKLAGSKRGIIRTKSKLLKMVKGLQLI
tara:strand:- start:1278 stop:1541 length:264 start_codon:yes stop_codon:yes gene_type:complete